MRILSLIIIGLFVSGSCLAASRASNTGVSAAASKSAISMSPIRTGQPATTTTTQPLHTQTASDPLPDQPEPVDFATPLITAIEAVRMACDGIASEINSMKTLAGINTAVTGVGTLAGGGALTTGLIKQSKDTKMQELKDMLDAIEKRDASNTPGAEEARNFYEVFLDLIELYKENSETSANRDITADVKKIAEDEIKELKTQSKSLGNWRTGLLAGNTATSVAGAVIANKNKVGEDLKADIDSCRLAVSGLSRAHTQAMFDIAANSGAVDTSDANILMSTAQKMIEGCRDLDFISDSQINSINKKSNAAMWTAIAGATVGAAGTVTSVMANTENTRDSDGNKEKNLNTASNVLAGGAAAASLVATVLNATQISAINKISEAADKCQGAIE